MSRKEKHNKMENKLVPISLCCLRQISVWVNFFHIGFTCNLSLSWMSAHCSFTLCMLQLPQLFTLDFCLSSAIHVAACSRIPQRFPIWIHFSFQFCASNICVRKVRFFIKIHLLYYFKIFLYEEHCQKSVICILPIIFLNLVLLTQLHNFLSYWTESTLFIVTLVRSQVHIFFLDHLIFFSVLQNIFVTVAFSEIIWPLHSRCLNIE